MISDGYRQILPDRYNRTDITVWSHGDLLLEMVDRQRLNQVEGLKSHGHFVTYFKNSYKIRAVATVPALATVLQRRLRGSRCSIYEEGVPQHRQQSLRPQRRKAHHVQSENTPHYHHRPYHWEHELRGTNSKIVDAKENRWWSPPTPCGLLYYRKVRASTIENEGGGEARQIVVDAFKNKSKANYSHPPLETQRAGRKGPISNRFN